MKNRKMMITGIFAMLLLCMMCMVPGYALDSDMTLDELLAQKAQIEQAIAQVQEDEIVEKAVQVLKDYWKKEAYGRGYDGKAGYLEIKWTRVVYIKDEIEADKTEQFDKMSCYVEFFLLSDYFGTAPYYCHAGVAEWVAFNKDGSFEVLDRDPISMYRVRTYQTDFSSIIDRISDRGSDFNDVFLLFEED